MKKHAISKAEKKAHKQARSIRKNARGRVWKDA